VAEETGQERTERATERRREETRKRGQVAHSVEVNAALLLFASFMLLMIFRNHFLTGFGEIMRGFFSLGYSHPFSRPYTQNLLMNAIWRFFLILMPVFILLFIIGIAVNVMQVGFLLTGEPLKPSLNKINPVQGIQRLFSRKALETLIKDILKIVIVGWIGYSSVKGMFGDILKISGADIAHIFSFTGLAVFKISMKILIGYSILAILDYAFQRWEYEKSMMMTRQELKEELKQMEGDPLLRARVRSVQRELARRRMMEEVPKAEVVITNPTELAVALAYSPGMLAPVVVAKGRRLIAERIRAIAAEAGVSIIENIYLAQALYKAVDIGHPIPENLYTAVAEVLAYVYKLKGKTVV